MGDDLLLRTPDEGGLPGTAEGADYHRSLWLLQKPTLSRRKLSIFFGAALSLGSPTALVITAIHIPLVDLFIRREERQLGEQFGEEWVRYKDRVRRWI